MNQEKQPIDTFAESKNKELTSERKLSLAKKIGMGIDRNRQLITSFVFGGIAACVILSGYIMIAPKPTQYGAVDIQQLMKDLTTTTFKEMINNPNSPQEAQQAAQQIKVGGDNIEKALKNISDKYHVVLIQKQALAYDRNVVDYTNEVRREANIAIPKP